MLIFQLLLIFSHVRIFTCTNLLPKKAYKVTKEKKDVVLNWFHLRCHNFDFHLCYTLVVGDLFIVVAVLVAAAAVAVVPVLVDVGKNAVESSELFYILVTSP